MWARNESDKLNSKQCNEFFIWFDRKKKYNAVLNIHWKKKKQEIETEKKVCIWTIKAVYLNKCALNGHNDNNGVIKKNQHRIIHIKVSTNTNTR